MFQPLLTQLQNPDPEQRIQAIAALGPLRHPKARQALRFVYLHDPDQRVRNAALQYLPGMRAKLELPPVGPSSVTVAPAAGPRQVVWDCVYCGTRDITGSACPNCGAPRPTAADETAAADNNAPLETLFQVAPNGPVNAGIRRAVQQVPQPGGGWQQQQQRAVRQARRAANQAYTLLFLVVLFLLVFAALWLARAGFFIHLFRR